MSCAPRPSVRRELALLSSIATLFRLYPHRPERFTSIRLQHLTDFLSEMDILFIYCPSKHDPT
jgi:hypothetical protein